MVLIIYLDLRLFRSKKLDIKLTKHTLGARDFSCTASGVWLNLYRDFGLWPTLKRPVAHDKKSLGMLNINNILFVFLHEY